MIKRKGGGLPRNRLARNLRARRVIHPQDARTGAKGIKRRKKRSPLTIAKDSLEETQKELTILLYGRDCYTCPQKNLVGQNCQLGHVPYPRAALSVRYIYDVRLTRIQCFHCNINCGGMGAVAQDRMLAEGFDPRPLKAESDAAKGKSVPIQWFKDKRQEYLSQLL